MEEEHRRAIQNNFGSLVEQTDLDQLVPVLYEKGVFSEAMIEPFRDSNKDARSKKRQLYRDIERRGPRAFDNLIEALTETGHWNLVRALDPESSLHPRRDLPPKPEPGHTDDFLSLRQRKGKGETTKNNPDSKQGPAQIPFPPDFSPPSKEFSEMPQFHVTKSTQFHQETHPKPSNHADIPLYPTRGRRRGVLVAFSFIEFRHNSDTYRKGAEVDCKNLKYLFTEIGFKPLFYNNLSKEETESTLSGLTSVISADTECVFIVVTSHGYERQHTSDMDVRCSDGKLISIQSIVERFNNKNFPQLRGVPKVFVFQTCRGSHEEAALEAPQHLPSPGTPRAAHDGTPDSPRAPPPPRDAPAAKHGRRCTDRLYSDILIAHSTLPGFVSHRDPEKGSWYIQALCEVFALRAHDCHVEELLKLVDMRLYDRFHSQTSSVDNWGFNKHLYLHPGLFEN